jgi:DNA-binding transcriptional regulator YiaG
MMRPSQVRRIRKEMGVTQVALAEMLGATKFSARVLVYRWENGLSKMSRANAMLLEMLLEKHRAAHPLGNRAKRQHEGEGDAA